jgi:ubiquinone/menaquinone biosynthesis C-methylase UbiE
MNLDESQKASQAQFDRRAACYGSGHILSDTSDVAAGLEGLDNAALDPALDVATGAGHTAAHLAARGLRVTAADLAPGMLEQTAQLAASRGLEVRTALHAAEELPYPDGAFGLVTCRVAAHHFSSVPSFLREVFRVLRPGGRLLVIDGAAPDGAPEAEEWIHRVEKLRDPSHGRFLTPSAWRAAAETAGFAVEKCGTAPFKQPDLEWYFRTADTSPENRAAVLDLVDNAPGEARRAFGITREEGKTVWWWPRLTLLARRPEVAKAPRQS